MRDRRMRQGFQHQHGTAISLNRKIPVQGLVFRSRTRTHKRKVSTASSTGVLSGVPGHWILLYGYMGILDISSTHGLARRAWKRESL